MPRRIPKRNTFAKVTRKSYNPARNLGIVASFVKHQDVKFAEKATGVAYTVSIIGGKNVTGAADTSTIGDINSDNLLRRYMEMYTEFKITRFNHKVIFNHTGNFDMRPMTITSAYSPNAIIHPRLEYEKMNAMSTV